MPPADPSRAADAGSGRPSGPSAGGSAGPGRRDLSAIPAFLRQGTRAASAPSREDSKAGQALPRPVTPPRPPAVAPQPSLDPATLPMPTLSRRRVVTAAGILVAGLLLLSFARQVGEATAASERADDLRRTNAALRADVDHLQADLQRVQDQPYILLAGRAVGLGGRGEIPFALEPGASPLPADAPGSASVRLGAEPHDPSPLEAWLTLLFGPQR